MAAISDCNIEEVRRILKQDPGLIDHQWGDAGTLLHVAVANGQVDSVRYLVEKGADIDSSKHSLGMTPLHALPYAFQARGRASEILQILLEAGADACAFFGHPNTALEGAAYYGKLEDVKLLFGYGGWRSYWITSPLPHDVASMRGHSAVAEWLRNTIDGKPVTRFTHLKHLTQPDVYAEFVAVADESYRMRRRWPRFVDADFLDGTNARKARVTNRLVIGLPEADCRKHIARISVLTGVDDFQE